MSTPLYIRGTAGGRVFIGASGKRFRMRAYSGGPLYLKEFPHPVVVDLQGMELEGQHLPCPFDHDDANVIGQTDNVRITANGIEATGTLDITTADGKHVVEAKNSGTQWEASIGAPVLEAMEEIEPGRTITVNNRSFTGPILIARKTVLKEISFVRRGADLGQTHIAIAARGKPNMQSWTEWLAAHGTEESNIAPTMLPTLRAAYSADMAMESEAPAADPPVETDAAFEEWLTGKGQDPATLSEEVLEMLRQQYAVESNNPPPVKAQLAEAERVRRITAAAGDKYQNSAAAAIANGVHASDFELQVLRAGLAVGPFIATGAPMTTKATIGAAIMARCGYEKLAEKTFGAQTLEASRRMHSMSLVDIARATLQAEGKKVLKFLEGGPVGIAHDGLVGDQALGRELARHRFGDIDLGGEEPVDIAGGHAAIRGDLGHGGFAIAVM